MRIVRRHGTAALSRPSITVEFNDWEVDSCFSFVPVASAAILISHPSQPRRASVRSSAPSVGLARRACSLGGAPTVEASWLRGLGARPRSWQSTPLQPSASSNPRGAERMRHRRCEYEYPLRHRRPVSPMTPNRALNRTLNQRRCACWFRAG